MSKLLAYTQCMRDHGISDFPDPTPGPGGQGGGFSISAGAGSDLDPNNPRYISANQACQSRLPYGGVLPRATPAQLVKETKLAACIRDHGYPAFPDPNNQGTFVLHGFDMSSPQFRAAMQTCRARVKFTGPMGVQAIDSGPSIPAHG